VNDLANPILECLREVATERLRRQSDPSLAAAVLRVKAFQHARFTQTYVDLLANPRYADAARFFLDDLYGPRDFAQRDEQFARVIPGVVRLFPQEIVQTVLSLSELHALSEHLDSEMGELLRVGVVDAARYGQAWRVVAQPQARERQIALMLVVGQALDGYTRSLFLRQSLRLMRGPANAAGLGALQAFLERGFDTFRQLRGAGGFLELIAQRERALAVSLFAGDVAEGASNVP
jgi:hypothetical protein